LRLYFSESYRGVRCLICITMRCWFTQNSRRGLVVGFTACHDQIGSSDRRR
jgi:hypothetical protein